jgi:hypothetical protein
MIHRFALKPGRAIALAVAVAGGLVLASAIQAQTWEYKSYKKDGRSGQFDRQRFNLGTVVLEEKDGKAFFRMIAGTVDACLRGDIPAVVTKTDTLTTIELEQAVAGCEPIRYVIRNDGSGGDREIKRGGAWVNDTFDHGLTLKK